MCVCWYVVKDKATLYLPLSLDGSFRQVKLPQQTLFKSRAAEGNTSVVLSKAWAGAYGQEQVLQLTVSGWAGRQGYPVLSKGSDLELPIWGFTMFHAKNVTEELPGVFQPNGSLFDLLRCKVENTLVDDMMDRHIHNNGYASQWLTVAMATWCKIVMQTSWAMQCTTLFPCQRVGCPSD